MSYSGKNQTMNAPPREEKLWNGCLSNDMLIAFVDGRLSAAQEAEVTLHLAFCRECMALSQALRCAEASEPCDDERTDWSGAWQRFERKLAEQPAGIVRETPAQTMAPSLSGRERIRRFISSLRGKPLALRIAAATAVLITGVLLSLWLWVGTLPEEIQLVENSLRADSAPFGAVYRRLIPSDPVRGDRAISSAGPLVPSYDTYNAHYDEALATLERVVRDRRWLHKTDTAQLGSVVRALQEAIRLASATEPPAERAERLADCHFYSGATYLLTGDLAQAQVELEKLKQIDEATVKVLQRKRDARRLEQIIRQQQREPLDKNSWLRPTRRMYTVVARRVVYFKRGRLILSGGGGRAGRISLACKGNPL